MKTNPQVFEFDYDGACAPGNRNSFASTTFSVGIFQWIPRASGKGLKKSKVLKRVRGNSSKPNEVFAKASEYILHYQKQFGFNLHPSL